MTDLFDSIYFFPLFLPPGSNLSVKFTAFAVIKNSFMEGVCLKRRRGEIDFFMDSFTAVKSSTLISMIHSK